MKKLEYEGTGTYYNQWETTGDLLEGKLILQRMSPQRLIWEMGDADKSQKTNYNNILNSTQGTCW